MVYSIRPSQQYVQPPWYPPPSPPLDDIAGQWPSGNMRMQPPSIRSVNYVFDPFDRFSPSILGLPPVAAESTSGHVVASPLDAYTHDILGLTIAGEIDPQFSPYDDPETRNEIAQILETMVSRQLSGRWGDTLAEVALARDNRGVHQFSTWNTEENRQTARTHYGNHADIIDQAIADYFTGTLTAPIPGTTHYYSPRGMLAITKGRRSAPSWAAKMHTLGQVGAHTFLADPGMMCGYAWGIPPPRPKPDVCGFGLLNCPTREHPRTHVRLPPGFWSWPAEQRQLWLAQPFRS